VEWFCLCSLETHKLTEVWFKPGSTTPRAAQLTISPILPTTCEWHSKSSASDFLLMTVYPQPTILSDVKTMHFHFMCQCEDFNFNTSDLG
jgi:hypothetical protein